MMKSFASNWVVYAALSHARKSSLFRGQKRLAAEADAQLKRLSSPRTSFGRQLRLLKAIKARPCNTDALCKSTGVSRRTLFRDLAALRNAGVKIVSDGANFALKDKKLQDVLGQAV
jgi:hypothetical protein